VNDDERADAALLAASADGDHAAFAVLVRRHVRSATLLAAQILGSRNDAEDVVQEAFLLVYRKSGTFDPTRQFAPWFFAIVRRLASNRRTRTWRQSRLLQLWHWATSVRSGATRVELERVASLDAEGVSRSLAGLSGMQRACFELVIIRGLSPKEVAAMHDISESTVRQHVFRARETLRLVLGTDGDPNES
jgi:RNA polymerase sigma-70 factor, ECF subfamily